MTPLFALLAVLQGPVPHRQLPATPLEAPGRQVARDSTRRHLRAAHVRTPIKFDGVLDDAVWREAEQAKDFVQSEPFTGKPATERTEAMIAFDDEKIYVAAYLHDADPSHLMVNDIKKDFREDDQDDFEVILDTFHDRRNGYVFLTNVEGARGDRQVANEGREINASWDAVWDVRTKRVADGWTLEMAIPFRALRFSDAGHPTTWGVNFSRRIRRKNEIVFWSPIPRAFTITRLSLEGELDSIETAGSSRDLRVKPFALARTVRNTGGVRFDNGMDAGVDVKYGVRPGLTLDVTVNPDFAQVEADEQVVNLTQFTPFLPEKREFFLENSGIFYVGDAARNNRVTTVPTPDEDLLLFFSRRIGLAANGDPIHIPAGLRLTGKAGGVGIGALSMATQRTRTTSAANYSVLRLRRNILRGSDIGTVYMHRQATDSANDWNRIVGVDANIRFFGKFDWNSYLIGTRAPGKSGGQYSWRSTGNYESNFFHWKGGVLEQGAGFRDDLGFYRRTDVRKYLLDTGIRPRPRWWREHGVREMHPHVVWNYYENLAGAVIAKNLHSGYTFFLNSGGFAELSVNPQYQFITKPFKISPTIAAIPAGGYAWHDVLLRGSTDASKRVSAGYSFGTGGLWSGTANTATGTVTVRPSYRFRVTAGLNHTSASLRAPAANFHATLYTTRLNYSFTRNMFFDALSQYDPVSHLFNANVRFNVIHHPLSDLFVVFNEQRLSTPGTEIAPGRSVTVKFTQMVAF